MSVKEVLAGGDGDSGRSQDYSERQRQRDVLEGQVVRDEFSLIFDRNTGAWGTDEDKKEVKAPKKK